MPPELSRNDVRLAGLTALLLLALYLLTMAGRLTSGDGETVYQTTRAIVTNGGLAVPARPEAAPGRGGAHYGKYGLGQSIAQSPFFAAGHAVGKLLAVSDDRPARFLVSSANAYITAALGAVFWLTARTLGAPAGAATAGTLVLGLCTMVWPYARSDFSEPLQTLALQLAFLLTLWWGRTPRALLAWAVGCAAALAFFTKAASVVVLAPLGAFYAYTAWVQLRSAPRRAFSALVCAALPFALTVAVQAALNLYRFGSASEFGYGSEPAVGFTTPVLSGIGFLLFSSGKGFIWFTAPAVLGLVLLPGLIRRRWPVGLTVLGIFGCELLYFARWWAWHGDWSWGPRYLYLVIPFLMLPIALSLGRPLVRWVTAAVSIAGLAVALLGVLVDYGGYYSIVGSQLGRGVDVREARLVPPFSPILGHAWLARASLHHMLATARDPDHDPRVNPAWGEHPWAASHPALVPEAPERAIGFDLWFLALANRDRFAEFWGCLVAAWLALGTVRIAIALARAHRGTQTSAYSGAHRGAGSVHRREPAVVTPGSSEAMELAWQRG